MKENLKNWLIPLLFTLGGALVGLAYYYFVGCATGSCAITSNPIHSMVYMGLIGWLLSGVFSGGCAGCYQRKKVIKPTIKYTYIGGFTLTQEDAKAYLYADSTKRRVHKWKDGKVAVFAAHMNARPLSTGYNTVYI